MFQRKFPSSVERAKDIFLAEEQTEKEPYKMLGSLPQLYDACLPFLSRKWRLIEMEEVGTNLTDLVSHEIYLLPCPYHLSRLSTAAHFSHLPLPFK